MIVTAARDDFCIIHVQLLMIVLVTSCQNIHLSPSADWPPGPFLLFWSRLALLGTSEVSEKVRGVH